jgi:hypothetical protein
MNPSLHPTPWLSRLWRGNRTKARVRLLSFDVADLQWSVEWRGYTTLRLCECEMKEPCLGRGCPLDVNARELLEDLYEPTSAIVGR